MSLSTECHWPLSDSVAKFCEVPLNFLPVFPCLNLGMVNRVFFYDTFLLIFFSIFISDFLKQIAGMIGTSILTVYQGHIRNGSLKSSAGAGWCLMSVCEREKETVLGQSFFSGVWTDLFLFFLLPRPNLQHLWKLW